MAGWLAKAMAVSQWPSEGLSLGCTMAPQVFTETLLCDEKLRALRKSMDQQVGLVHRFVLDHSTTFVIDDNANSGVLAGGRLTS